MTTKGIIFSAPMVRALLDGRKTQTRRIATFVTQGPDGQWHCRGNGGGMMGMDETQVRQWGDGYAPYAPSDRLYVRESFFGGYPGCANIVYRANQIHTMKAIRWTPSIHMPRRNSRLWLDVTEVRVQRLQDISEADAIAEGIDEIATAHFGCPVKAYAALWNSLHGAENDHSWEANPWIVAVSFAVHHGNVDEARP